jgi:hypothetical protein
MFTTSTVETKAEEEGGYEYVSNHKEGAGKEEPHTEPAVLYQPLGETGDALSFGTEWQRILIEYGSRCEQYGGHWSGHSCVGIRHPKSSPAAKYIEDCVKGTSVYGFVDTLIDAVKVSPEGAAVTCLSGIALG